MKLNLGLILSTGFLWGLPVLWAVAYEQVGTWQTQVTAARQISTTRTAAPQVQIDKTKEVVIGSAGPLRALSSGNQRFANYFELKADQKNSPLYLTLTNGTEGSPRFNWLRVLLANRIVATEKTFRGGSGEATINMTGNIESGINQFVVNAIGPRGAAFSWKLSAVETVRLDSVTPTEAGVGETLILSGENFSETPQGNQVTFNNKTGAVISATRSQLTAKPPSNVDLGDNKVAVIVNGVRTKDVTIKIRGIPEVTGTSLQGVPPGEQLIIYGKNFSKNMADNQVLFGETLATVVSATSERLTVVVPDVPLSEGVLLTPIAVKVGKMLSKNTVSVRVGPKMYQDPDGFAVGPDTPVIPSPF